MRDAQDSEDEPERDNETATSSEEGESEGAAEAGASSDPAEAAAPPAGAKTAASTDESRRKATREKRSATSGRERGKPKRPLSPVALVAGALIVGAVAGWFGRDARAALRNDGGAPGAACKSWEKKICDGTSAQSAACLQAQGATGLLPSTACDAALGEMPATLAKIKLERAPCDDLVKKLCGDLEEGSATCTMVKERSESFPPDRCKEMLSNYDEVIGQLKRMEQMQGMQGRPGMQGHPGMQGNPGMQGGPQSAPPPGPGQ